MKTIDVLKTVASGVAMLPLLTGCVAVTKYFYRDTQKSGVRFESVAAASTFYEALLAKKFQAHGPPNGIVTVSLPMPYSHVTHNSANVLFNSAVAWADTNHDGVISAEEARVFAAAK